MSTLFRFFRSQPPLLSSQRAELELLMRKCVQIVGAETIQNATVVEDLSQLQLDDSTLEALLMTAAAEVRARMNLTDASVSLEIGGGSVEDAAAVYISGPDPRICVAESTLSDPLQTVVSLAHEYAHHILLSRPDRTEADADERLTDLLPVCFGFGILASDAALSFASWSTGTWSGWSISKLGYLNALEIGYAMAMFAFQREERKPHWQQHLRADAGVTMKAATKYYQSMRSRNTLPLFTAKLHEH